MQTASKKVVNGWAMYDWANSVYNLVITTTFFPLYFLAVTKGSSDEHKVQFLGRSFVNSSLYDYTLAASYLFVALLYPILTSIADTRGNKKSFMKFFCYMGALGCSLLFFFEQDTLWLGIIAFMMAAMGYVGSLVFYNAYLPELAAPEDRDRISARGFSFGYVGSVLMQLIGFALVMTLSKDKGLASRITFLLVGFWWVGFAQITFARLPDTRTQPVKKGNVLKDGFIEIKKVYHQVVKMPVLKRFLRGFFFYSMGVQTVMLAATIFGSKVLNLPSTKLILTVVLIQLVAVLGAWGMSKLSAVYGNLKVLMGVVGFWVIICLAAFYTANMAAPLNPYHDKVHEMEKERDLLDETSAAFTAKQQEIDTYTESFQHMQAPVEYCFYALAIGVGLVMGGIQSLSRSTYAKLMPETKDTASFFSYYDVTEKIAIVIGIFSFGYIDELTGNMKYSVLSLIVFFAIGFFWLYLAWIKQKKESLSAPLNTASSIEG